MTIQAQITQLLNHLHRGGAWRFLWTPNGGEAGNKKRSVWYPVDQPVTLPASWADKNVYFGVNPSTQRREYYEASINNEIAALNCLFAEFDGADFTNPTEAERDAALTEILKETPNKSLLVAMREALKRAQKTKFLTDIPHYKRLALAHVNALDPAPSVIWDSGSGYHAVWLLDKTFPITSDADRTLARHVQAGWVNRVSGDPGAKDLRRVLRFLGTTNRKKHFAPHYPTVEFIKFNLDQVYPLADLAALLPTPTESQPQPQAPTQTTQPTTPAPAPFDGASVIQAFNAGHRYRDLALTYGYTDAGGNRLSRPGQPESGGVELDPTNNRGRHWSSNDEMHDPHWKRPFDLYAHFEHGGNVKAAVKAAAAQLGIAYADERQLATVVDPTTGEIIPLADLMEFCRGEIARRMAGMKDSQTNVALAVVQIFEHAQTIEAPLSDRHLAGLAAVTHQTANYARKGSVIYSKTTLDDGTVKRTPAGRQPNGLDQWLITRTGRGNGILADTYQLSDEMFHAYREKSSTKVYNQSVDPLWMISRGMLTTVESNMVDDAFIRTAFKRGVKRLPQVLTPAQQTERVEHLTTTQAADEARYAAHLIAHSKNGGDFQRLDTLATLMNGAADDQSKGLKSFTTTGLHIIAALTAKNGQNLSELAEMTHRHEAVISAAVKRLARTQIQEMTIRPLVRIVQFGTSRRVFIYRTWQDRLALIRSKMCTDGLLKARQIGYANQRIRRIDKILPGVRNEELRELYQEIRERTVRMIGAIEGKRTAKEAAALIHQEIAQENVLSMPTRPDLAPPAPFYRPTEGDVLTAYEKKVLINRLADGRVVFEVYDLGVREGEFSLPVANFAAQVLTSRPRVERQGVPL